MKKVLAAFLLLISSASFAADISINGTFATNGSTFPIAYGSQVRGGSFPVADNTARDAIDSSIRIAGMEVYSVGAGKTYRLVGGIANGNWAEVVYTAGTVTSVDLSMPNIFTVSGNPVTSTGTLTATLASQSQNLVWSSPNGSSGAPTFRALAAADIPSLSATYLPLAGGTMSGAITFSGTQLGTYTLGGTPTLGASLAVGTTASYGIGDTTHLLTSVATAKITGGSSNTSGHTVPNVADDTVALLAASQTLTNKTINGSNNTITNILPDPTSHSGEYLTTNGTTFSWAAVAAGGTLQDAYDGGAPTIVVTSGLGGIVIKDAATPLGAPLLSVKSNDGSLTYFSVSAGSPGAVQMTLSDGASAAVSAANTGRLRYNNTSKYFEASMDTSAYAKVPTISSSDTWTNKTFTAPIINGATSASGNFDLSGSTSGTFKTTGGASTFGGSSNLFSAAVLTLGYDGQSEAVSSSGTAKIRYNNSSHALERSLNGGSWTDIAGSGATGNWTFSGDEATDTSGAVIKSSGTTAIGLTVDSTAGFSNGASMQAWKSNGTLQVKMVYGTGGANPQLVSNSTSGPSIYNSNTDGMQIASGVVNFLSGGNTIAKVDSASIRGNATNTQTCGTSSVKWSAVYSNRYIGLFQGATTSGAVTVDPTLGEVYRLLANGAVSGITISAGSANQIITLVLVQDSGGTSTWPTTFTNARIVGGTFTKTAGANKVDTITFRYNTTDSKWDELHRALDIS